jgi:hypothetical protein
MDSDFKHATEFLEAQSFTQEPRRTCGGWSGWTRAEGNEKEMFVVVGCSFDDEAFSHQPKLNLGNLAA